MSFSLDQLIIENDCRASALAIRMAAALAPQVEVRYVSDGRSAARPAADTQDPFGAGKRRAIVMRRRTPFLMGCPAGSSEFACCGYLVMVLASNCPMDCSYCFLQEYLADNPGFQVYSNYAEAFDEVDRLARKSPSRHFRIGTGELADSLAFDRITAISRDLVEYFASRDNLLLELKTKTDEIDNLLTTDPKGHTLVSWTVSPMRVFESSEHRTASPQVRIAAARRVLEAGYKVAFHLDPIIAYPGAETDYRDLIDEIFDTVPAEKISFISLGGLRMTPTLRTRARQRFPRDPMLAGEEVMAPDGRMRTFTPLRLWLYSTLNERIKRAGAGIQVYLCMENASVHERVFGATPATPAALGKQLAGG